MKRGSFAAGFLTCLLLAGVTTTAYAAGIVAERSHHRVVVDGKEAQMEAYVINGNNYVKLRDIGKAVGFEVYWDGDAKCVQVESGKPYTGIAPVKAETSGPASQPETTTPADDVDAMKQDIVDRTNALRRENGVAVLRVNDRLMQAAQVRANEMATHPSILTQGRMAENSIPSRIVLTWPKISIASQIGCCLTRHLPNGPWRIGALRQPTTRTWSTQSYLRLALGWQEVSMILVTRAGTVSSFSSTMAIPSLGWIHPRTNKSSTLTQEQVVKICSFYCAFWKGERHEVN